MSSDRHDAAEIERQVQQHMSKCVHFNGIQHDCCKAGVEYKAVREIPAKGPYRWPCLTVTGYPPASTVCELRKLPTREEAEAWEREINARIDAFLAELSEGKTCPHCHKPIESRKVIGRCKYVYPCGHRLGQVGGANE